VKGRRNAPPPARKNGNTLVTIAFFAVILALICSVSIRVISGFSPGLFSLRAGPKSSATSSNSTAVSPPTEQSQSPEPAQSGAPPFYGGSPGGSGPSPSTSAAPSSPAATTRAARAPGTSAGAGGVVVTSAPPTAAASSPAPSGTPTPSPTTPVNLPPVTVLTVNSPDSPIVLSRLDFGSTLAGYRAVTLAGIRPRTGTASQTSIDWGDGTGTTVMAPSGLPGGDTLTHTYATDGSYLVTWTFHSDRDYVWSHLIALTTPASQPPAPQADLVAGAPDALVQHFAIGTDTMEPWTGWTLDYGDGTASSGAVSAEFTDGATAHTYDGSGHTATLTVADSHGQLETSTLATP
jgi:hypothetical protein